MRKVALIVVLAFVASGCLADPTPWVGTEGPYVGTLGDSLVHSAETGGGLEQNDPDRFLSDDLVAAGFHSSVSAMIGAVTADLADVGPFPEPQQPDILVIGLGTNDMRELEDHEPVPVGEAVGNIIDYIDASPALCSALITIVEGHPELPDAVQYNDTLEFAAVFRTDIILADWAAVVAAHPEYLKSDGFHHTEEGKEAYRQLIVAAAQECETLIDG